GRPLPVAAWRRLDDRRNHQRALDGCGALADPVRGPGAVRLHLPLRLCHADRRLASGHLVRVLRGGREPMSDINLLSVITFLPLLWAAVLVLFERGADEAARRNARRFALLVTGATFVLSVFLLAGFDADLPDSQFVEEGTWLGGLTYKLGVDGI